MLAFAPRSQCCDSFLMPSEGLRAPEGRPREAQCVIAADARAIARASSTVAQGALTRVTQGRYTRSLAKMRVLSWGLGASRPAYGKQTVVVFNYQTYRTAALLLPQQLT